MANVNTRTRRDMSSYGQDYTLFAGSFFPKAALAPVVMSGKGFTVSRVDVGRFLVTLTDPIADVVSIVAARSGPATTKPVITVRIPAVGADGILTFEVTNAVETIGVLADADIAAATTSTVSFECVLQMRTDE